LTKSFAVLLSLMTSFFTVFLPRWKRLTLRARLYDGLQPFEVVKIGDKFLNLFIPDRTCVYWAKEGPESEPMTNAWIRSFNNGETFIDIGANIGLYSLMAAAHGVSRVYAIEPNPFSYSVLARNIIINNFGNVIIPLCLVMNEKTSVVTFKLGGLHAGGIKNEIVNENQQPAEKSIMAAAFSLDELIRIQGISSVNHLKIDVDGLELEILNGATGLLSDKTLKSVLVEDNLKKDGRESGINSFLMQFGFSESHAFEGDGLSNKIFTRS